MNQRRIYTKTKQKLYTVETYAPMEHLDGRTTFNYMTCLLLMTIFCGNSLALFGFGRDNNWMN